MKGKKINSDGIGRKKKLKLIFILSFSFLLTVFALCGVFGYLSLVDLKSTEKVSTKVLSESRFYEYIQLNQDTAKNHGRTIFLSDSRLKKPFEYIPQEKDRDHNLISNFGEEKYQCVGNCYCSEEYERRSSTSVFSSRSLFYLITALTSAVAMNKAKKYFTNECHLRFDNTCSEDSIQSEVEYCESINSFDDDKNAILKTTNSEDSSFGETNEKIRKFFCHGNCVSKSFFHHKEKELAESFNCDQLKNSGEVIFQHLGSSSDGDVAVEKFEEDMMTPFCKEQSYESYYLLLEDSSSTSTESSKRKNLKRSLCQSSTENIFCIQTFPKIQSLDQNSLRYFEGKQILSLVRGEDFAHPGEEEAIDLLVKNLPEVSKKDMKILDIGSGLGGTSHHFQELGWGDVTGFDLEDSAVEYAKKKYPNINFFVSDVCQIQDSLDDEDEYDMMYMFNVFFAFGDDQERALECLHMKVNKESGVLAIFDYTNNVGGDKNRLYRKNSKFQDGGPTSFVPIEMEKMEGMMERTGWRIVRTIDISDRYEEWYIQLMEKLENKKDEICERFGEEAFERAKERFSGILESIQEKETGGVIIYAKPE